jgi:hypothetical protein
MKKLLHFKPLSLNSETESVKTHLEHFVPELPNIYLRRDIKSVSELYGQTFTCTSFLIQESNRLSEVGTAFHLTCLFLRVIN